MKVKMKYVTCCAGMANCLKQDYIKRDIIGNHIFYAITTDKKDSEGNPIGLVLQNCLCCGKEIYPDLIEEVKK